MSASGSSDGSPQMPRVASAPNVAATDASGAPTKKMPRITSRAELNQTLDAVTEGERDHLKIIAKVNERMRKVGLTMPGVEVRWNNLLVELEPPGRPVADAIRRAAAALTSRPSTTTATASSSPPASPSPSAVPSTTAPAPTCAGACVGPPKSTSILDAGSGCLPPGRMCLLLGPPGAGRTTLLKALAGQLIPPAQRRSARRFFPPSNAAKGGSDVAPMRADRLMQRGSVSYNGLPADGSAFEVARAATYVAQTEVHLPELTVAETLTFAAECQGQGMGERLQALILEREAAAGISPDDPDLELLMTLVKQPLASAAVVELYARMLGIDHVMDTLVGNEMLKGISGGQKRRVTVGEMAVGMSQVMMLDEITNGLDAAAALGIARSLRNMCEHANATILATLLQPSPDVVECFHDVMLLSGGRLVYHGPREGLLPFFGSMGLAPMPGQSLADFLQEVVASPIDQARYRVSPPPSLPPPMWSGRKWISPKRMCRVFHASEPGREMAIRLADPPYNHELQKLVLRKDRYGIGTAKMWLTVLRREATLALRNKAFFAAGVYQVLLIGFLLSTGFVRLKHNTTNDANLFMSVMFFGLMSLFMTGFNFAPIYCYRLSVFYKQRDHRFFSPTSYAVATVLCRLPEVVLQAVSFSVMVYFSCGFTMEAGRFFLFLFNLLLAGFNSITTFTLIASLLRNESATQGMGAVFMMVSTLMSGFPIAPGSIPGWWIWVYWIAPMSWNFRSLVVTEMTSSAWPPADPDNPSGPTVGLAALDMRGIPSDFKWVWAGLGTVAGLSLLQILLQIVALTYLGPLRSAGSGPEYEHDDDDHDPLHRNSRSLNHPPTVNGNGSLTKEAAAAAAPRRRSWGSNNGSNEAWSAPSPAPAAAALGAAAAAASGGGNGSLRARPPSPPHAFGMELTATTAGGNGAVAVAANGRGRGAAAAAWDAAAAAGDGGGGKVLAFKPVVMAFRDVCYFVRPNGDKNELQLLDRVSGVFRPGVLTSLMGASGAGKTTLMDVLAGRKTGGRVEGRQLVNGAPKRMAAFTRFMGYVEQLDVHNPYTTVEEALLFSARLRVSLDLLLPERVKPFVRQMMEVVELVPVADRIIGLGGPAGGLSTEARKRLTIAVELVANPSIVFMDEPTSGLDARAAGMVMRAVRNTVATGRTVVCTIHQPNREIMDSFDELLLLKPGGRTIYFGPLGERQADLVSYLSSIPGVGGYLPHMNPAEWMLEVTSPAAEEKLAVDFAEVWAASEQYRAANQLIEEHCTAAVVDIEAGNGPQQQQPKEEAEEAEAEEAEEGVDGRAGRRYAQPTLTQLWVLMERGLLSQWRNRTYNMTRFGICFALAGILGSLYWGSGAKRSNMMQLMNIVGMIFCAVLFKPMTNLMMVMPQVVSERAVFYREKASGMYRPAVFAAVQALSEMPSIFLESIMYVVIMYTTVHFEFDSAKAMWFWLYMWLALMLCTFMGMGFMNVAPNMPAAIAGCSGLILLWNLFCGFLIYRKDMKAWYLWAYYGNPFTYIIYGCITTQMGDVWDELVELGPDMSMPVAQFVQDTFSYDYSMRGWIVLILLAFIVAFRGLSYLGLLRFNFQNR